MLEQSAGLGIGRSISRNQVLFAVHRLFNPRTRKGLLSKQRSKEYRSQCEQAEQAAVQFFDAVAAASRRLQPNQSAIWWRTALPVTDTVTPELRRLQDLVSSLEQKDAARIPKEELTSAKRLLGEAEMLITEFLTRTDPDMTRWVEIPQGASPNVALLSAPTSIAESVGPLLFREQTSVILTSATLAVGGNLSYYQNRIGAFDAQTLMLGTPFNFRKQMRIVVAAGMPQPDDPRYEEELPGWIQRSIHRTHGRSLVLFTNASLMRRMAERLRGSLEEDGIPLLVQKERLSRHGLLQEFRADVDSVLFGLESFWMGIDVPGEALQHVIITRLPFAVPDHPLIQSRMEYLKAQGEQPFFAYSLPEAVLKLRQGVGRLIRRSDDTGLITILDSRIVQKSYGRIFLESLPRCPIEVIKEDGEVEDVDLDG
jgi:ATP-dependent DNA helicase DinG